MSISYEEALATLQSMFAEPWTRETLDSVLRNQKGHMENTVDLILRHGEKDPQALIEQLEAGIDPQQNSISVDEELARQLQRGENARQRPNNRAAAPIVSAPKGRGTPTTLPDDFLRIPGAPVGSSQISDDEALARMLQDEMFSQQVQRSPDLAHLARSAREGPPGTRRSNNRISELPARWGLGNLGRPATANGGDNNAQQPNIMNKISELGDNARKRLNMLAAQFNASRNNAANRADGTSGSAAERTGLLGDDSGDIAEQRGLLNNEEDSMELAARNQL